MKLSDSFSHSQMPLESRLRLALPARSVRPGCVFVPQFVLIKGLLDHGPVKTVVSETGESPALLRVTCQHSKTDRESVVLLITDT